MPVELDRLKAALSDRYAVEHELGRGGMATVYLATDSRHERMVAVKVLRPELSSAIGWERFKREIRLAAPLSHPHILPIHDSGEADGFLFYVTPYVEGESLQDRLRREGRLPLATALRIARHTAAALDYAHRREVIHRDIKPGNILLSSGEAVVADFGIAKALTAVRADQLTQTGLVLGSPAYMSPEQLTGGSVDGRTDIYSLGCVVYEMLAGQPPFLAATPAAMMALAIREEPAPLGSKVAGIPPRVEKAVRRALAKDPKNRFGSAGDFAEALTGETLPREGGRGPSSRLLVGGGATLLVALLALGVWRFSDFRRSEEPVNTPRPADIAVLPCTAAQEADSSAANALARMAALYLDGIPNLREVPVHTSFRWWEAHRDAPDRWLRVADALGADRALRCTLVRLSPDRFEARVELIDRLGNGQHSAVVTGPATDPPVALADSLALAIVRALRPAVMLSEVGYQAVSGHHPEAVRALIAGEAAFQRGAWALAERHYTDALAIDSTFVLARWRLADIRRWTITASPADLRGLDSATAVELGQVDRLLLEARLAGHSPEQLRAYEAIVEAFPDDAYAMLIYGDELFHRGPLWGVSLDSARRVLQRATRIDTFLQPGFDHLVLAELQHSDSAAARKTLERLTQISAVPPEVDFYLPALWQQAYLERFEPTQAAVRRPQIFSVSNPQARAMTALASRRGLSLNLADTELALGEMLAQAAESSPEQRATGYVAQGLALFALGRPHQAFARFDSAAAFGQSEAVFQSALWRVVPGALGLAGILQADFEEGERVLKTIGATGALPGGASVGPGRVARAVWALGLSDVRAGDTLRARRRAQWLQGLSAQTGDTRLATLLEAALEAASGRYDRALAMSAPLLAYDSAGKVDRPFGRSAIHLLRAEWSAQSGDPVSAARELVWHENEDLEGIPAGAAQAAEVDWALGTYARLRRAQAALAMNEPKAACRQATEVLRVWSQPEPQLAPLERQAGLLRAEACGI